MNDRIQRRLLHDHSVSIDVDARLAASLAGWLPRNGNGSASSDPPQVRISAHLSPPLGVEAPPGSPVLRWGSIGVWLRQDQDSCVLCAPERDVAGMLDFESQQATVVTGGSDAAGQRLCATLTLASALLLGRMGRLLAMASTVVSPSGRAWLIVGAEGSGAVTAAVRLGSAGWKCLGLHASVLREVGTEHGVDVEGWVCGGAGKEYTLTPGVFPLAGALLLCAEPEKPTRLNDALERDLLSLIGPMSPWVWFDRQGARGTTRAMHGGLSVRLKELRLGLDSYADPARLAEVLAPLC